MIPAKTTACTEGGIFFTENIRLGLEILIFWQEKE
ncbi:hypothetical protein KKC1_00340 [Calderihabitans maritimus]|uniref:Uncharacterized protein n=1 Tax=Calderihabitans maritimus TaxID=1246530 RepID=A0A1Z5HMW8_9FIRM|nr:hypothetical protein KKC1_00340 [Calderihabitans maritimus]